VSAALDEVTALLREVTGDRSTAITADTRLEGDLRLDSVELAALSERLGARHAGVDLLGHVATLSLDDIIALTVGDVAACLRRTR
jgi:hypothetical protein